MTLPENLIPLLNHFAIVFSHRTWVRFQLLMASAVLTAGRRTFANLLRTLGPFAQGHTTSYQRVFSSARWSALALACVLTRLLLQLLPPGPVRIVGDDTVDGHPGRCVWGKGRHRDPVRSSHSYTAYRYGHKWIVLAVLVRFPWASRDWALPVLVDLYLTPQENEKLNRRHRTPAQLLCRLVRVLLRWFPQREFVLLGDSGYGTHEVARLVDRHRERLQLVSKFYPDANLFEPAPPYNGHGRPRVKGEALPKPEQVVAQARKPERVRVDWYGGGRREVEVVTGTGHWHKSGKGQVLVRWVYVHDITGTHRDEYLYTTNVSFNGSEIVSLYTARWHIETTFQEMRSHVGLETTQGWCEQTVRRLAPCLFGLYSMVALVCNELAPQERTQVLVWPGKVGLSFSDAITCVRRWFWRTGVFEQGQLHQQVQKLPEPIQHLLFTALAPAC